jgi:tRNA threonylcarbamoyladenosine biosynthesis protein TsaB
MRVLALDTSGAVLSAALVDDDRPIAQGVGDPSRSQAEQLPGALLTLLAAAESSLADVDVFAIAAGPGSFTGIRIGMATMQGLATVTARPVVAVSTLDALAHAAAERQSPGALIAAWMDARRRQVFSALFEVGDAPSWSEGRLVLLDPPAVDDPRATLARWAERGDVAVFIGDGDLVHPLPAGRSLGRPEALAATIGCVAAARAREGLTVTPGELRPLYVRRPDAELARDGAAAPR